MKFDGTIDVQFVFYVAVLLISMGGAAYVLREKLEQLKEAFQQHVDEDEKFHEEVRKAIAVEQAVRETAVQEARRLTHAYSKETQSAIQEMALEHAKTMSAMREKNIEGLQALALQVENIRGRVDQHTRTNQ